MKDKTYYPSSWIVFKVKETGLYKLLGGSLVSDGYLNDKSWRVNSGITHIEDDGQNWLFHGTSGSVYVCAKTAYAMRMAMGKVFYTIKDSVDLLDEDTNWMELDYSKGV